MSAPYLSVAISLNSPRSSESKDALGRASDRQTTAWVCPGICLPSAAAQPAYLLMSRRVFTSPIKSVSAGSSSEIKQLKTFFKNYNESMKLIWSIPTLLTKKFCRKLIKDAMAIRSLRSRFKRQRSCRWKETESLKEKTKIQLQGEWNWIKC